MWCDANWIRRVERVCACELLVAHGVCIRFVSQKLQVVRVGVCPVISSCSWLGFAQNWPICHVMPLLWKFGE